MDSPFIREMRVYKNDYVQKLNVFLCKYLLLQREIGEQLELVMQPPPCTFSKYPRASPANKKNN